MIFYFLTFFVILFSEKLTKIVSESIFKSYVREIEEDEAKIEELENLSILAMMMGEREAYIGLQNMMSEIYGKVFFRKIAFFTPLFFLILSPYMLIVDFLKIGNPFTVVAIAILYFSSKLAFSFIKQNYKLWKMQKEFKAKNLINNN